MPTIKLVPVAVDTIYRNPVDLERYVEMHPESTAKYLVSLRNQDAMEDWTFLQPMAAESFRQLLRSWREDGGEFYASDMLRTVLQQIEGRRLKPTLMVKPGHSLHQFGGAIDFDTARLGKGKTLGMFQKHMRRFDWSPISNEAWHMQCRDLYDKYLYIEANTSRAVERYLTHLASEDLPLTGDEIKQRLLRLGYASSDERQDIARFQKDFGLPVDGVVGSKTSLELCLLTVDYERLAA